MKRSLVLTCLLACAPARSPSEQCRQSLSAGASDRDRARCEAFEREERLHDRRAEQEEERAYKRQANAEVSLRRELAAIRQAPRVPAVGAELAEAQVMCDQQHGRYDVEPPNAHCRVAGVRIFACVVEGEHVSRCDGFYEGADLATKRAELAKELGAPEREGEWMGNRVVVWKGGIVTATTYARGVRVTRAKPDAAPPY